MAILGYLSQVNPRLRNVRVGPVMMRVSIARFATLAVVLAVVPLTAVRATGSPALVKSSIVKTARIPRPPHHRMRAHGRHRRHLSPSPLLPTERAELSKRSIPTRIPKRSDRHPLHSRLVPSLVREQGGTMALKTRGRDAQVPVAPDVRDESTGPVLEADQNRANQVPVSYLFSSRGPPAHRRSKNTALTSPTASRPPLASSTPFIARPDEHESPLDRAIGIICVSTPSRNDCHLTANHGCVLAADLRFRPIGPWATHWPQLRLPFEGTAALVLAPS